jgi:hypothetical protein
MIGDMWRALRGLLRPAQSAGTQMFIDEDVVGGLEVLPASTAGWCAAQMVAAAEFAQRHALPGNAGWSDVYIRPAASEAVVDLKIAFAPAVAALAGQLPEFDSVVTGSLDNPQKVSGRGFGPSPLAAVVVYRIAGESNVSHIDLALRSDRVEAARVLGALASMPTPAPLLAVDWWTGRMARFDGPQAVAAFAASFPDRA